MLYIMSAVYEPKLTNSGVSATQRQVVDQLTNKQTFIKLWQPLTQTYKVAQHIHNAVTVLKLLPVI